MPIKREKELQPNGTWKRPSYVPAAKPKVKKTPRRKNSDRNTYSKKMKRCKYCKTTENLTVDHKVPLVKGGADELSNWQCLCEKCNSMKSEIPEKRIKSLFKWFLEIQKSREEHGKKPYTLR